MLRCTHHSCHLWFHASSNGYWCWCAAWYEKPVSGLNLVVDWPTLRNLCLSLRACSNFCCHFVRFFPLADWSKINLCQRVCFLHLFVFSLLEHSDHLCVFPSQTCGDAVWAGICVGVHASLWFDLVRWSFVDLSASRMATGLVLIWQLVAQ